MAYGTRRFYTALTKTLQQSLSWAELLQFLVLTPFFKIHSNTALPSALWPSWRSLSCPSHSSWFNSPDYIRWTVQLRSSPLWNLPRLSVHYILKRNPYQLSLIKCLTVLGRWIWDTNRIPLSSKGVSGFK